jgi:hypothetical protein
LVRDKSHKKQNLEMPRLGIPEKEIKILSTRNKRDPKKIDKTRPSQEDGGGVSSQASLIIFVKVLVGNTVSSGHHAKAVSSS